MSAESARAHAAAHEPHATEGDWHRAWIGLSLVVATLAALVLGVTDLPREAAALPSIARHAMLIAVPQWGSTEPVNEIVYGTRAFDTFGETFLLLAAVVSVVTLSRTREPRDEYVGESVAGRAEQRADDPSASDDQPERTARRAEEEEDGESGRDSGAGPQPSGADDTPLGAPGPEHAEAMTVVVGVSARIVAVILAVSGVYLAAWGYTPGGGFPAGAALVGVLILLYAALGRRAIAPLARPGVLEPVELAGALAIVVIGVLGIAIKNSMFANYVHLAQQQTIRAGGTTQLFSAAELIEVATGLGIAVFALLGMEHDWAPDPDQSDDS